MDDGMGGSQLSSLSLSVCQSVWHVVDIWTVRTLLWMMFLLINSLLIV